MNVIMIILGFIFVGSLAMASFTGMPVYAVGFLVSGALLWLLKNA